MIWLPLPEFLGEIGAKDKKDLHIFGCKDSVTIAQCSVAITLTTAAATLHCLTQPKSQTAIR